MTFRKIIYLVKLGQAKAEDPTWFAGLQICIANLDSDFVQVADQPAYLYNVLSSVSSQRCWSISEN